MTGKIHKKMPIRHTRKQRAGDGFLDWFIPSRWRQPSYGPIQYTRDQYGQMQPVSQRYSQFTQGLGQSYNQFGQRLNDFGQNIGQSYNQIGQSLNDFGQYIGDQFGQNTWQQPYSKQQNILNPTTYSRGAYAYGGKTKKPGMKGGYKDNISETGLAASAAPFSGPTAQPHKMVGGKTRRGGKKGRKTRRNKN
jgi:hypothetical protein